MSFKIGDKVKIKRNVYDNLHESHKKQIDPDKVYTILEEAPGVSYTETLYMIDIPNSGCLGFYECDLEPGRERWWKPEEEKKIVCTCSNRTLLHFGCKCGAFKKEKK